MKKLLLISVIVFILLTYLIYKIADNLEKAGDELNNTSLSKAGRILIWIVAILVILFFLSLASINHVKHLL